MRFGICQPPEQAAALEAAGWDFVEGNVQSLLRGQSADFTPPAVTPIPLPVCNGLVPGSIPLVGPAVDRGVIRAYMKNVLERAGRMGIDTLVFGSGAARKVPDGFDRSQAEEQIRTFLSETAPVAQQNKVTIVIEPLTKGETNIITNVAEAMTYVKAVDHPAIQCLVDSYHFWLENEPLGNLEAAMPWIKHVHVADTEGRVAPGISGKSDYKPFFAVIKRGGYDARISVECGGWDTAKHARPVLAFLRDQWNAA